MDLIGGFLERLFSELKPILDWAVTHWAVTLVLLAALIYWVGRRRRLDRHHF
jgi:hypothetical protein